MTSDREPTAESDPVEEREKPCRSAAQASPASPRGAAAMRGFARRFRPTRTTAEWLRELRER